MVVIFSDRSLTRLIAPWHEIRRAAKFQAVDLLVMGTIGRSDFQRLLLAADRSPERVNLYEIMAKPVLSVNPEMNIRYCARLLERFGIMRAPVISHGQVMGIVSFHDLVLQGLMELIKEP